MNVLVGFCVVMAALCVAVAGATVLGIMVFIAYHSFRKMLGLKSDFLDW